MKTPSLEQAQKIVKDKRYSAAKRRAAKKIILEAKRAGKLETAKKSRTKKVKRKKSSVSKAAKSSRRTRNASARKKSSTKSSRKKASTRARTRGKVARKSKSRRNPQTSSRLGGKKIKFYDATKKKHVLVPRSACKLRRGKGPRARTRVVAVHKGKKYSTPVPKGFKL